jgi:hypothetical protein
MQKITWEPAAHRTRSFALCASVIRCQFTVLGYRSGRRSRWIAIIWLD